MQDSLGTFLLIPLGGVTLRAMSPHPKGVSGNAQTPHPANSSDSHLRYLVADMSCEHCRVAVTEEVQSVSGVASVNVDLDAKLVIVHGCDIDGEAVIAAIDEAGYDAVFDAAA